MRIVNNSISDLDMFWATLGRMQAKAWLMGREQKDILVEEAAAVVEALQKPGFVEAGKAAYAAGISLMLDDVLNTVEALQSDPDKKTSVKEVLLRKITATPLLKVTVRCEKRTVTKKTVEEYDTAGRIKTIIEERVQI